MKSSSHQKDLMISIIFAAVLIACSLLFLGWQMQQPSAQEQPAINEAELVRRITADVLAVVQSQQTPQQPSAELVQQIKEAVLAELQNDEFQAQLKAELLAELQKGEFLDQQIETGIQNFIKKQQDDQRQAQIERAKKAQEQAKNVRRVSLEQDHIYGDPGALISLIEYSDFECPLL